MRLALVFVLLIGVACGALALMHAQQDGGNGAPEPPPAPEPQLGPYPLSQFLIEHDLFLPATDPETLRAEEAEFLLPEDEVFGVVVRGAARAYPATMLSYHHVVNDVIRGIPVAITY